MIVWDFSAIFALGLTVGLGLVLSLWVVYTLTSRQTMPRVSDAAFVKQCEYCAHVFMDYQQSQIKVCPRCGSYLEDKDLKGKGL